MQICESGIYARRSFSHANLKKQNKQTQLKQTNKQNKTSVARVGFMAAMKIFEMVTAAIGRIFLISEAHC